MVNPNFYYGDYYQLGFVLKKTNYYGMAIREEYDAYEIRVLYLQLFDAPKDFDDFVKFFLDTWWHEYLHVIGFSHEMMNLMDNFTVEIDDA